MRRWGDDWTSNISYTATHMGVFMRVLLDVQTKMPPWEEASAGSRLWLSVSLHLHFGTTQQKSREEFALYFCRSQHDDVHCCLLKGCTSSLGSSVLGGWQWCNNTKVWIMSFGTIQTIARCVFFSLVKSSCTMDTTAAQHEEQVLKKMVNYFIQPFYFLKTKVTNMFCFFCFLTYVKRTNES